MTRMVKREVLRAAAKTKVESVAVAGVTGRVTTTTMEASMLVADRRWRYGA